MDAGVAPPDVSFEPEEVVITDEEVAVSGLCNWVASSFVIGS